MTQVPIHIGFNKIIQSVGSKKIKLIKSMDYFLGTILARILPPKKSQKVPKPADLTNILIIRPGGIGDAIFLLPFISIIKKSYPHISIDILCEKRNREIFNFVKTSLNRIHLYDSFQFKNVLKNSYDLIIDTEQWHYLSAVAARIIPHKFSIGFSSRPGRVKFFDHAAEYDSNAYEIENFKKLFFLFSETKQIQNINNCVSLEKEILDWATQKIYSESVCIFLGASIPVRRLDQNQILEVTEYILKKNLHVILLGGKDVLQTGEAIVKRVNDPRILNFAGKISIAQSSALIKTSKLFIGPDSGLMHLACAVGTPVIGLFGPGNLKKWGPKGQKNTVVTENVVCAPCTAFGYTNPTCGGTFHCMKNLQFSHIPILIENILNQQPSELTNESKP